MQTGGKWDLRSVKLHMISKYGHEAIDALFEATQVLLRWHNTMHNVRQVIAVNVTNSAHSWLTQAIIIRALLSVQRIMISDKHCFELYGYVVARVGFLLASCATDSSLYRRVFFSCLMLVQLRSAVR